MKKQTRILSGILAVAIAVIMTAVCSTMNVVAQTDVTGGWNAWVTLGFVGLVAGIFAAVIIWALWGESKTEWAKAGVVLSLAFGLISMSGAVMIPVTPVTPIGELIPDIDYGYTLNPTNQTGIADNKATYYTWHIDYNTTSNLLFNGTGAVTFNMTVYYDEPVYDNYPTDAELKDADIPILDQEAVISKTHNLWDIVWTNSDGDTFTQYLPNVIQEDHKSESISCSVTLNDEAIEELWSSGDDMFTFYITLSGIHRIPVHVTLWDTVG